MNPAGRKSSSDVPRAAKMVEEARNQLMVMKIASEDDTAPTSAAVLAINSEHGTCSSHHSKEAPTIYKKDYDQNVIITIKVCYSI